MTTDATEAGPIAPASPMPSDLVEVSPEQIQLAYQIIRGEADVQFADPEQMARQIGERIAQGDSFEDVFATPDERKLPGWADKYMGVPVLVKGLRLNPSQFNDGDSDSGFASNAYAVVDIVLPTGEVATVSCGGYNVLHQLVRMVEKGWTDRAVRMTEVPTHNNRTTLWLVRAE